MHKSDVRYGQFLRLLEQELVPAMGCTEPVALAYAAARARELLGGLPERVVVRVSGNILKNAKSVVVPGTGGLKGIPAAVAAGLVAGEAGRLLEVISRVTEPQKEEIAAYLARDCIAVEIADSGLVLDIDLELFAGEHRVRLRIVHQHTNVVLLQKDGETLLQEEVADPAAGPEGAAETGLDVRAAMDFVRTVALPDVEPLLRRQMEYNSAIARTGLAGDWGANVGRVLLESQGNGVWTRAKAVAAAGSDARMSGCELPVVILSGSGNQGMTACLPVMEYAAELGAGEEETLRAVLLSDLLALHMKSFIGRLSAYCGVVCAGAAAGAAIAYLHGGGYQEVVHTIVNALATSSGMVCDGAKPSCAAKIAMSVEAGLLGCFLYRHDQQFYAGDGIIKKGVENTLRQVGRLGREGMRGTDEEILKIMLE